MVKNINGDIYSDLITSSNPNTMNADSNRKPIDIIVIHHNATTNKDVAMATWLTSGSAGTSAHYEITPTEIIGCVGENYTAYHAGNYSINQRSIGLEHVNNTGAPSWTIAEETYHNSAKLIADIAYRYDIPIDSSHIIPHRQVSATACPGGIDMTKLIQLANLYKSGQATSTQEIKEESETDMLLVVFKEAMDGFLKDGIYLFNFARGTYNHLTNMEQVNFVKKQYPSIRTEEISRKYPAHIRYINAFKLKEIK